MKKKRDGTAKKSEPRTSIHFDKCIEHLVAYNAAAFGLKNSVSAGIYLFSKLTADQQKKRERTKKTLDRPEFSCRRIFWSMYDTDWDCLVYYRHRRNYRNTPYNHRVISGEQEKKGTGMLWLQSVI